MRLLEHNWLKKRMDIAWLLDKFREQNDDAPLKPCVWAWRLIAWAAASLYSEYKFTGLAAAYSQAVR